MNELIIWLQYTVVKRVDSQLERKRALLKQKEEQLEKEEQQLRQKKELTKLQEFCFQQYERIRFQEEALREREANIPRRMAEFQETDRRSGSR